MRKLRYIHQQARPKYFENLQSSTMEQRDKKRLSRAVNTLKNANQKFLDHEPSPYLIEQLQKAQRKYFNMVAELRNKYKGTQLKIDPT